MTHLARFDTGSISADREAIRYGRHLRMETAHSRITAAQSDIVEAAWDDIAAAELADDLDCDHAEMRVTAMEAARAVLLAPPPAVTTEQRRDIIGELLAGAMACDTLAAGQALAHPGSEASAPWYAERAAARRAVAALLLHGIEGSAA